MNIASPIKREKIPLNYSMLDTGHPGITSEHNRNTPGYIFLCYGYFSRPENHPGYVLCTCMHPMTSSLQKKHDLVVGHTPSYIVSNSEANQTNSSQDTATFTRRLFSLKQNNF